MKKILQIAISFLLLSFATSSFAQTDPEPKGASNQAPAARPYSNTDVTLVRTNPFGGYQGAVAGGGDAGLLDDAAQNENVKIDQAVRAALKELKKAESDGDKDKAEGALRDALDKQYDQRLNNYEKYLDELEDSLKKMRDQLERRRNAKSEIVRLKLQMLKYEVDDLGWPSGRHSGAAGGLGAVHSWPSDARDFTIYTAPALPGLQGDMPELPDAADVPTPLSPDRAR
jgi:hypothetical protein